MKLTKRENRKLKRMLKTYLENPKVQEMREYIQHGAVSTYDHSLNVTKVSFWLNRRLKLHAKEKTLVTGAILHDFYLYDWHNKDGGAHDWHGYHHADTARHNAKKYFNITKHEEEIIKRHMWPLNITRVPNSRESLIVCMADKYVSLHETLFQRKVKKKII